MSKEKKLYIVMFVMIFAIILIILEIFSQVFFYRQNRSNSEDPGFYLFDSKFGWIYNDGEFNQEHFDFKVKYTIKDGRRLTINKNEYGQKINLFGDSMTFGIGVRDEETIASQLSMMLRDRTVENYGVSGFGPDQYWLMNKKVAEEGDINIFMIYTGNDYQDINTSSIQGTREKPYLKKQGNSYTWIFPSSKKVVKKGKKGLFKSASFLRTVAKSIPFIISIRSKFVKADTNFVKESIERIDHLYKDFDRDNTYFVIMPSISVLKGISTNTSEGEFLRQIVTFLRESRFKFVNINEMNVLEEQDFWKTEGHTNQRGNTKIAKAIFQLLIPQR